MQPKLHKMKKINFIINKQIPYYHCISMSETELNLTVVLISMTFHFKHLLTNRVWLPCSQIFANWNTSHFKL